MKKYLPFIAILFVVCRCLTIHAFKDTYYFYGMVASQFAIAEAAFKGHWFKWDETLASEASQEANRDNRFVPLEEWNKYEGSGHYTTYPTVDLPGFGYIIAFTSKIFDSMLTAKYAHAFQVLIEGVSLLIFVSCIAAVFGNRIAIIASVIYIFFYPYIWPVTFQPMRDIFIMGVYAFYQAAYFVFSRRQTAKAYALITALLISASLLLWIRPSGYYFFFMIAPAALFMRHINIRARTAFLLLSIILPFLLFGMQYKRFNIRHYGVSNTHLLERGMWEGMGIIENNPYGFKLDDQALVPWGKSMGYDYEYGSPELNKLLGDYVKKIIREDPGYYIKTILVRSQYVLEYPLYSFEKPTIEGYKESGLSKKEYVRKHPEDAAAIFFLKLSTFWLLGTLFHTPSGALFFHLGLLFTLILFVVSRCQRLDIIVLMFPMFYSLATQIPLHFEARYFATGAWVLVLPFAWFIDWLFFTKSHWSRQFWTNET